MSDLTLQILPKIKGFRMPGLELDEQFVYPDYQGGSILNLPASISQWLGAGPFGAPTLHPQSSITNDTNIQRVILVLVDALALQRLQCWMNDGSAPVWSKLAQNGQLAALTSVVPSTTASALTSLWTGRSPAEHGVVGYELWLKEYGVVSNMILHSPITFENDAGSLARAGFNPEQFLNLPTLGSYLASHGIRSYAMQHRSIIRSGLSQMFLKDVDVHGYLTPTELWVNLRHLVEANPRLRQYFWVYTGQIDHYSHYYHPDDERVVAEFGEFSRSFEQHFLEHLSPKLRKGTLILLTADHGMIVTQKSAQYDLRNHPGLSPLLHIRPTGEHRLMYLFLKPGQTQQVRSYFNQAWPDQFIFLDPTQAIDNGLFGPGTPHSLLAERLGDLIVVARGDAYLWWANKDNPLIGQHGGLSADEMIVPFLTAEL
jgi:predicted AlkP superfamily pyrophosphatase or phosphodiesterase